MHQTVKHVVVAPLLLFSVAAAQVSDTAFVRVANLSPNAPEINVQLVGADEGGETLAPEELSGLGYRDATDYLAVPGGTYDVSVETPEGNLVETLSFSAEGYYTVAAIGLVVPENLGEPTREEEGGFFSFFSNLFGDGGDSSDLELQLIAYDDEPPLTAGAAQASAPGATDPLTEVVDFARVRLIHAAPGTAPISLVSLAEAAPDDDVADLVTDLSYADASSYNDLDPNEVANLEVRVEGSEAAALTLAEGSLAPNEVYTLFVIGTPLDEAPIETLLLSSRPTNDVAGTTGGEGDAEAAGDGGADDSTTQGEGN
jgi:hypothetical protein